jgi:hypothetical protein
MNYERNIKLLFDYFYNKVYKGTNFSLDLSVNNQFKVVESFKKLLANYYPIESLDTNFLIFYMAWSFKNRAEQLVKRKISLNWIIGKKALGQFVNRNTDSDYYVDKFLLENNIKFSELNFRLHEVSDDEDKAISIDQIEEAEKLRFEGQGRLYNCLLNTTMYNHRSVNCLGCEMKTTCKALLKQKFPATYKKRGYDI